MWGLGIEVWGVGIPRPAGEPDVECDYQSRQDAPRQVVALSPFLRNPS